MRIKFGVVDRTPGYPRGSGRERLGYTFGRGAPHLLTREPLNRKPEVAGSKWYLDGMGVSEMARINDASVRQTITMLVSHLRRFGAMTILIYYPFKFYYY